MCKAVLEDIISYQDEIIDLKAIKQLVDYDSADTGLNLYALYDLLKWTRANV